MTRTCLAPRPSPLRGSRSIVDLAALLEQDQVGGGVWVKLCIRCRVVVVVGKCPNGAAALLE